MILMIFMAQEQIIRMFIFTGLYVHLSVFRLQTLPVTLDQYRIQCSYLIHAYSLGEAFADGIGVDSPCDFDHK